MSENRRDDLMRVIRTAVEQPGRGAVGRPIDEAVADAVIAWIDHAGVVVAKEPVPMNHEDHTANPEVRSQP